MSTFKVIQILDANTIRVSPHWKLATAEGEMVDDKIKIFGLNSASSNEYVRLRLESFLLNKEVELINPQMLNNDSSPAPITCTVLIDKTDITYYFPEFKGLPVIG